MNEEPADDVPEAYGAVAALRYRLVESAPGGFAQRMAPRVQRLFEASSAQLSSPPKLLDVGCGTGELLRFFGAAGYMTTGVDPSEEMLAQARRSGVPSSTLILGGVDVVPTERRFDLITATFNVLNHLPDHDALDRLLVSVAHLLAPGGQFIFDINTPLGLEATSQISQTQRSATFHTDWTRAWEDDRLILRARGWFEHDGHRYDYDERISKIAIEPADLSRRCEVAGLSALQWLSDDLMTPLERPEHELVAFGVASAAR